MLDSRLSKFSLIPFSNKNSLLRTSLVPPSVDVHLFGDEWQPVGSRDTLQHLIRSACYIFMPPRDWPCAKEACAIQKCLNSNNLNEAKCKEYIDTFKQCCDKVTIRGEYSEACGIRTNVETSPSNMATSSNRELE
jgi:hypothetical protein